MAHKSRRTAANPSSESRLSPYRSGDRERNKTHEDDLTQCRLAPATVQSSHFLFDVKLEATHPAQTRSRDASGTPQLAPVSLAAVELRLGRGQQDYGSGVGGT
jgi:hypothetical protein